jgi:Na+-transporting NADH:ubiquinone oxidoreductase subunit NqrE
MSQKKSFLGIFILFITLIAELVSLLTSYMVVNRFAPGLHDGIFHRCGALNYFQFAVNSMGSFVSKVFDGSITAPSGCYWWNSFMFQRDES